MKKFKCVFFSPWKSFSITIFFLGICFKDAGMDQIVLNCYLAKWYCQWDNCYQWGVHKEICVCNVLFDSIVINKLIFMHNLLFLSSSTSSSFWEKQFSCFLAIIFKGYLAKYWEDLCINLSLMYHARNCQQDIMTRKNQVQNGTRCHPAFSLRRAPNSWDSGCFLKFSLCHIGQYRASAALFWIGIYQTPLVK